MYNSNQCQPCIFAVGGSGWIDGRWICRVQDGSRVGRPGLYWQNAGKWEVLFC